MKSGKSIIPFIIILIFSVNSYAQTGWYYQNSGLSIIIDFWDVCFTDINTGYICGDEGIILKTTNGGNNWTQLTSGTVTDLSSVRFINSNTGYVTGFTGLILKTTNAGANWNSQNSGTGNSLYCIRFLNQNFGMISGSNCFLQTTNGGNNWLVIPTQNNLSMRSIFIVNESIIYSCGYFNNIWGKILKSTNGGVNWDSLSFGFTNFLYSIWFTNANTGYVVESPSRKILKTTNAGASWSITSSPYVNPRAIQCIGQDTCFIAGSRIGGPYDYGALISTNAGASWLPESTPTVQGLQAIFMLNSTTGYIVGTGRTILKTTNSGITPVSNLSGHIPNSYKLEHNYPNPFNPVTTILFEIPAASFTSIIVYDILGNEITTLVKQKLNPGSYEVNWNGSDYPSGIYICKLTADGYSDSKKMILVK